MMVPLLSLQGIEGAMFKPTAIAVAAALFGALVLNLTLQPVLSAIFLAPKEQTWAGDRIIKYLSQKYEQYLRSALDHRRAILIGCVVLTAAAAGIYSLLGKEFVPPLDEGSIMASTVFKTWSVLAASCLKFMITRFRMISSCTSTADSSCRFLAISLKISSYQVMI